LRWRLWVFYAMCRLQRHRALVPRLSFAEAMRRAAPETKPLERANA
jgi:hypothetical protein